MTGISITQAADRLHVSRRPHVDGLDAVITLFTEVREHSIEAQEQVIREYGNAEAPVVGIPAASLDSIILELEEARRYRNQLHDRLWLWRGLMLVAVLLNVVGFVANMLSAVWR